MLTSEQLLELVGRWSPMAQVVLLDDRYSLPDAGWVDTAFSTSLSKFYAMTGLLYQQDKWDCDDYAKSAWVHASISHARTRNELHTGLAFGWLTYTRQDGVYHAINWFAAGRPTVVYYYEPQTRRIIRLELKERQSVDWIIV